MCWKEVRYVFFCSSAFLSLSLTSVWFTASERQANPLSFTIILSALNLSVCVCVCERDYMYVQLCVGDDPSMCFRGAAWALPTPRGRELCQPRRPGERGPVLNPRHGGGGDGGGERERGEDLCVELYGRLLLSQPILSQKPGPPLTVVQPASCWRHTCMPLFNQIHGGLKMTEL